MATKRGLKAPAWYADWRHDAVHELMAKQDRNRETYGTDAWPRFDYDLEARTLTFSDPSGPKVCADIQVVGTTGSKDWLWGWANDHWPSDSVIDVARVRSFGEENGVEELTSAYLEDEDLNALGWELTAVTARIVGAVGAYRPPGKTGALFLVYRSIRHLS